MDINYYYENTLLTIAQIAARLNLPFSQVYKHIHKGYSSETRKSRKSKTYALSKTGIKNPYFGKTLENHPKYIGEISDCKGYLMQVKPDWYSGRKGSKHVFVHHVVICLELKITAIPKGWCVHHCDFNPHNNHVDNLVLLRLGDLMRLHRFLEGVTTISKESTLKWVEKYGTPWRDDIVSSTQECVAAKAVKEVTPLCEGK